VHKNSSNPKPIAVTSKKDDGVIKLSTWNMKRVAQMRVKDRGKF